MAVIVEDTIEIIVSNPQTRNSVTVVNPALKNTINVSQGYTVAVGTPGDPSGGGGSGTVTSITAIDGLTGGTITTSGSIGLEDTDVTPGTYTLANITVDSKGRITYATDGSGTGGTDLTIDQDINITNYDAAFSHMTTPIVSGTAIQDILIDMLQKYNAATITLSSLNLALQNEDGTWPEPSLNFSSTVTREIGGNVRVYGFGQSISDHTKVQDDSVSFYQNNSLVEGGFDDMSSFGDLSEYIDLSSGSAYSNSYKLTAIDDGGSSDITISSNTRSVRFRYRAKVGAYGEEVSSDNYQTIYDDLLDIYDELQLETTITANCTTDTDNVNNFTYIIYPAAWGEISEILQAAFDVTTAFTKQGPFLVSNTYGTLIEYYFYKSNDPGAFAPNVTLTISF